MGPYNTFFWILLPTVIDHITFNNSRSNDCQISIKRAFCSSKKNLLYPGAPWITTREPWIFSALGFLYIYLHSINDLVFSIQAIEKQATKLK
jgi:hypothetical protein